MVNSQLDFDLGLARKVAKMEKSTGNFSGKTWAVDKLADPRFVI